MGVACGDFDGDGLPDLAVTNFFEPIDHALPQPWRRSFQRSVAQAGLAAATRLVLGFGLAGLDANNDGWPDLAQANGHVSDQRPLLPYEMPAQLLLNVGGGQFIDVSNRSGAPWQVPRLGRGLAVGDIDNDGRTDVLIVAENAPLALLHNRTAASGHWLTLLLEGTASNRDAVGARVVLKAGGKSLMAARAGRRQLPLRERSTPSFWPGRGSGGRRCRGHMAVGPPRSLLKPCRGHRLPPA